MACASEDHRSATFPEFTWPLLGDVARLFDTQGPVAIFPATGTGGWEAALTNTVPAGAVLLQTGAGQFAELWRGAAEGLGYRVEAVEGIAWGSAPDPQAIEAHLAADTGHRIAAVLVVHNETSTGVTADLPAIRGALDASGHPALLMSDGVSAIASLPYHHDAWGIDVALTGSQKGLMLPAGLALLALSARAAALVDEVTTARSYFDLRPMFRHNRDGYFPYTPSIPMLHGLRESLALLFEEGLDQAWTRHHRLAEGVRAAVEAWGFERCCREWRDASDTVTTVMVPEGVSADALIAHAHRAHHLDLGGGLGPLADRAFRIGHLGDLNEGMVLGAISLVELALSGVGCRVPFGSGAAAALRTWSEVE
jgi:alanine-glyoxylate transaminase/serine-glyoxylate transaminase/serine-pyruvate transaminase